jgi:hypothetical protein
MQNMKWTSEKPTVPGWYWYRMKVAQGWHQDICKVYQVNIDTYDDVPHDETLQMAGPIPEPEE